MVPNLGETLGVVANLEELSKLNIGRKKVVRALSSVGISKDFKKCVEHLRPWDLGGYQHPTS